MPESHWDRLPPELHALIRGHNRPFARLARGEPPELLRLSSRAELELLWADVLRHEWAGELRRLPWITRRWAGFAAVRSLAMLDRLLAATLVDNAVAAQAVVRRGWAHRWIKPTPRAAAVEGAVEVLAAMPAGSVLTAQVAAWAAGAGQLAVVRWLHERLPAAGWQSEALVKAAAGGHLAVAAFLLEVGAQVSHETVDGAAGGGHTAMLEWLAANGAVGGTPAAGTTAARHAHADALAWLAAHDPAAITPAALVAAASGGSVLCVEMVQRHLDLPLSDDMVVAAAAGNSVAVLEWMHRRRPAMHCAQAALDAAVAHKHAAAARWIHTTLGGTLAQGCLEAAVAAGSPELVEWVLEVHPDAAIIPSLCHAAVARRTTSVVWVLVQHCPSVAAEVLKAGLESGMFETIEMMVDLAPHAVTAQHVERILASGRTDLATAVLARNPAIRDEMQANFSKSQVLYWLAYHGKNESVRWVLANTDASRDELQHAASKAGAHGHEETARLIVEHAESRGVELHVPGLGQGWLPMMLAAQNQQPVE
ncbi:hypothetical protein HK105_209288 [Polyrhizophydium stewartii]|uniref:Ankyrin repeat domain-containing protein n=1 Tax=Polyrhizophydium stewartii TaxID=2732419 RepID=A0ABR4MVF5_9FUNG|nr:hypothetical protein HK105_000882 [Polyrhizophydium stewartii]